MLRNEERRVREEYREERKVAFDLEEWMIGEKDRIVSR